MKYRSQRHAIRTSIVLTARGMGRHFTHLNISRTGAGIFGSKKLNVGEGVTLNYPNCAIDAVVKWTDDRHVGVAFKSDLGPENLNSILKKSAAAAKRAQ